MICYKINLVLNEHEVEKIVQIGQAVQKLWPNFNLYVNVTQ